MVIKGLSIAALSVVLAGGGFTIHRFLKQTEGASKIYQLAMENCEAIIPSQEFIGHEGQIQQTRCYKKASAAYYSEIKKAMPEKVLDATDKTIRVLRKIAEKFGLDAKNFGGVLLKQ